MGTTAGLGARTAPVLHGAPSCARLTGRLLLARQAASHAGGPAPSRRRKAAARIAASAVDPPGMQHNTADGMAGASLPGSKQLQAGANALDAVRAATEALGRQPGHTEEQLVSG